MSWYLKITADTVADAKAAVAKNITGNPGAVAMLNAYLDGLCKKPLWAGTILIDTTGHIPSGYSPTDASGESRFNVQWLVKAPSVAVPAEVDQTGDVGAATAQKS